MNIRLRQLRAFLAIVDTGSVSEASNILGRTQPSVSKTLASFERELGFKLFDRVGRRLRLSEQGRLFLEKARNAIESLEDIRTAVLDVRENQGKRLRVCAIGPLAYGRLIPVALARFAANHPDYAFSVETKHRIEIEEWVLGGHSDIGFTLLPRGRGQLNVRALAHVQAVAIVPLGHELAKSSVLAPADLASHDMVMPRPSVRMRGLVEAEFLKAGKRLRPRFETANAISTVHLVAQGAGVAVVDPFSASCVPGESCNKIPFVPKISLSYGMIWSGFRSLARHEVAFFGEMQDVANELSDHNRR